MNIKSSTVNPQPRQDHLPRADQRGADSAGKPLGVQHSDQARAKIRELSQEFESIFLNLMLSAMRKSVPKSELMDGGNGEEIFRSMLDQEYAKSMAQRDMTGLARAIESSLLGKPSLSQAINKVKGNSAYKAQTLSKAAE